MDNMDIKKAKKIYDLLRKEYFHDECFLIHNNVFELLVATILSAQCTDKRVNIVTEELFDKYKKITDYSCADVSEFEIEIKSTGFYKNKAKNIIATAKLIKEKYNCSVPDNMDDLLSLPGVARKTANIVLFHGFGKIGGIAVDTHVKRLSYRLGLTTNIDPGKIEKDLMRIFKKKNWGIVTNLFIEHGRKICNARKPFCNVCFLKKECPRTGV